MHFCRANGAAGWMAGGSWEKGGRVQMELEDLWMSRVSGARQEGKGGRNDRERTEEVNKCG